MNKRKVRPPMPLDQLITEWVKDHGEAMKKKDAAELVGVSPQTIRRAIGAGMLRVTPNGRVLTRSLCAYANGFPDPVERRCTV